MNENLSFDDIERVREYLRVEEQRLHAGQKVTKHRFRAWLERNASWLVQKWQQLWDYVKWVLPF